MEVTNSFSLLLNDNLKTQHDPISVPCLNVIKFRRLLGHVISFSTQIGLPYILLTTFFVGELTN